MGLQHLSTFTPPGFIFFQKYNNKMKLVSAYLLAVLGGKANPEEADIKNILSSVGVEADSERLSKLLSELKGKDVYALIDAGSEACFIWRSSSSRGRRCRCCWRCVCRW